MAVNQYVTSHSYSKSLEDVIKTYLKGQKPFLRMYLVCTEVFCLAQVSSNDMEGAGLMIYTTTSHQGAKRDVLVNCDDTFITASHTGTGYSLF